jgi:flagellar hook-associated protein 1 FlgK
MSLVATALQIGRSALTSYQSALQVLGNNVSNAGDPDYTRQTVGLGPLNGVALPEGFRPGAGVALTSLKRNLDESLEHRLRMAISGQHAVQAEDDQLSRIEVLFDEVVGIGMRSRLSSFFNSFSEVHNNPADAATRAVAIGEGAGLALSLRQLRSELLALAEEADSQISGLVEQANGLASGIADLNAQIVAAEAGDNAPAAALRDQRDAMLRQLSEIVDVHTRIQEDGALYVFIGSEALVQGNVVRELATDLRLDGESQRTAVVFADTGADIHPRGGALAGIIAVRDRHTIGTVSGVDQLASALIAEVNRIHSDGQGLSGFTSVTGTVALSDTTAALDSADAGLELPVQNGSFFIVVSDDTTQTPVAYQIDVDLDGEGDETSLESLVETVNSTVIGVTASVTADGRLKLEADAGVSFTFGHDGQSTREDTSDVLAAFGINTFFTGSSAADIAVNDALESRPDLLAAAQVHLPGDGANAARLAALDTTSSSLLNNSSLLDYYSSVVGEVATTAGAAHTSAEAASAVLSSLQAEKEAISGVSLDEEAVDLLKFERAFQGAARYITVVDRLMDEMMTLVR